MFALGLTLLAAAIVCLSGSPSELLGDRLTRGTVRLALSWYAAAAGLMLFFQPGDYRAQSTRGRLARWCWTWGWVAYIVHLSMAFHWMHGWSHARAIEHVRAVAGWGDGIYFSHLFTLVWTADVTWWWVNPPSYASRSPWIDRALHAFMLFMIFNGTIVYEQGFIRWAGFVLFTGLSILAMLAYRGRRVLAESASQATRSNNLQRL